VAIVEDDLETAELYKNYINSKNEFCCPHIYSDIQSFLNDLTNRFIPDLLILDIGLPDITGNLGLPLIMEETPDLKVIILSIFTDNDLIVQCFLNGAWAYESKDSSLVHFYQTLYIVSENGFPFNRHLAHFLIQAVRKNLFDINQEDLRFLQEVASGFPEEYVAQQLKMETLEVTRKFRQIFCQFISQKDKTTNF
jgi:DNA-binding NarL/FixJ family response regulator